MTAATLGPVLLGIEGAELTAQDRDRLHHPLVGGVVLFSRNFKSRAQLLELVSELRALRNPRLLLTVDQEGGRVQRFREGFTTLPALGRIGQPGGLPASEARDHAYWHARIMASEMLEVGIDLSFAPVLDLDRGSEVIGDRAFSSQPQTVIELGRAYLAGMRDAGMKATGKHFPGHGSVRADSHVADVCDERSFQEIADSDLLPFAALAGELEAMMIAHVAYPCLDDQPAGYSTAWLGRELRQRIGFKGVIFSDDLGMHAAKTHGNLAQRAQAALAAGCDAVLVCRPEDVAALVAQWDDAGDDSGGEAGDEAGDEWAETAPRLETLYGSPGPLTGGDVAALVSWRGRLQQLC